MKEIFDIGGEFKSCHAAEEWCKTRGLSVGQMQRCAPRMIVRGDAWVAKWRNLSRFDKMHGVGQMTGDMRNGPVVVSLDIELLEATA